jgi:type IV pilus assembly protein PilA
MPEERINYRPKVGTAGFTLVELMISVGIVGILSMIAIPNYTNSIKKARQADTANQISQIQNTIQAYREEYLKNPESWSDLARITPVATSTGPASGGSFSPIKTPNGEHYSLIVTGTDDIKSIYATPTHSSSNWNIKACIDTNTGYSDMQKGNSKQAAATAICEGTS